MIKLFFLLLISAVFNVFADDSSILNSGLNTNEERSIILFLDVLPKDGSSMDLIRKMMISDFKASTNQYGQDAYYLHAEDVPNLHKVLSQFAENLTREGKKIKTLIFLGHGNSLGNSFFFWVGKTQNEIHDDKSLLASHPLYQALAPLEPLYAEKVILHILSCLILRSLYPGTSEYYSDIYNNRALTLINLFHANHAAEFILEAYVSTGNAVNYVELNIDRYIRVLLRALFYEIERRLTQPQVFFSDIVRLFSREAGSPEAGSPEAGAPSNDLKPMHVSLHCQRLVNLEFWCGSLSIAGRVEGMLNKVVSKHISPF